MVSTLTVAGVDVSCDTDAELRVSVGRDDVNSQASASVLTATLVGWPAGGELGDPVTLTDGLGSLFVGTVTDLETTTDDAATWPARLIAAGPLAELGRRVIGDEPWPQESDSQRVARILDLVDAPHAVNPGVYGPEILPRDVDRQPALRLAQDVAGDALGVLWEQPADPATPIRYSPQRLRAWSDVAPTWAELPPTLTWAALPPSMTWETMTTAGGLPIPGAPPALTLDCSEADTGVVFSQRIGDLVRRVRVAYGPTPEGGSKAEVIAGDVDGIPEVRLDTELADDDGANAVAETIWRSRREPLWRLAAVTLRLHELEPARVATIRAALAVGTRLTMTLPPLSPVGSHWEGYLEGWEHQLAAGGHELVLRTSERRMTEPADRWQDISPSVLWSTLDPAISWDQTGDLP